LEALMRTAFDSKLAERLMRYAAIDTQSDASSDGVPSTQIQLDLAGLLINELAEMGLADVKLMPYGAVLATIPGTAEGPTIGFCAHLDTAPQFNGYGVKPRLHSAWDGAPIHFPDAPHLVLDPGEKPYLASKIGDDIITASGATLLGADDKSGIAVIMTLAEALTKGPGAQHGPIRIAFTPDEEIGRGVDPSLPGDMACDFAYTLDGADLGEVIAESFSADFARVAIRGVSIHPGDAKGILVNALHLAAELITAMDVAGATPETTSDREGFAHVIRCEGGSAEAELDFILRDFERDGLAARGQHLRDACAAVEARHPGAAVTCEITEQYRNMRYWLEKDMRSVDLARAACAAEGIAVIDTPIRGGTDGSRLTELGLPCPNLFTGMQELHGPLEYISVQDMAAAVKVCLRIVERAAKG
jgi:tripeptide aminopeptidase